MLARAAAHCRTPREFPDGAAAEKYAARKTFPHGLRSPDRPAQTKRPFTHHPNYPSFSPLIAR
jgi:hypothetical protein